MDGSKFKIVITIIVVVVIGWVLWRKTKTSRAPFISNVLGGSKIKTIYIDRKEIRSNLRPEHQLYSVFNPCIFYKRESGDYIALFRVSTFGACSDTISSNPPYDSVVYKTRLNREGSISDVQFVDLPYEKMIYCYGVNAFQLNNGVEDPRIFYYRDKFWGAANANGLDPKQPCVPKMVIWEFDRPRDTFCVLTPPFKETETQKNWTPFVWKEKLLFEYSINPHIIIEADPSTGKCKFVSQTKIDGTNLYGGAVALPVHHEGMRYMFNICHMDIPKSKWSVNLYPFTQDGSTRWYSRDYYHFFYLFDDKPPFTIRKITPPLKMGNSGNSIQFVTGITYDDISDKIVISYGEDDCESALSYYSVDDILEQMKDTQISQST